MDESSTSVERTIEIPVDPDQVWEEIGDGAWLGDGAEMELRPGGIVTADGHLGVIEHVEEPHTLRYRWWSTTEPDTVTEVHIEVIGVAGRTLVHVTERMPLDATTPRARAALTSRALAAAR